jgi:hypothetical protein
MKTTRTYLTGCTWCNATGMVRNSGLSTTVFDTCPVCNGAKTIIVTETTEGNDIAEHGVPISTLENPHPK